MFQVPGVEAPEGIPGQAKGGGSVKVAVPLDLDTHDASLWGKQETQLGFQNSGPCWGREET